MTVKECFHKFNQLPKYAPDMMADSRTSMSKFLVGVSSYVVKECRFAILNRDMDLSWLMTHAHQIEAERLKRRMKGNRKARIRQFEYC